MTKSATRNQSRSGDLAQRLIEFEMGLPVVGPSTSRRDVLTYIADKANSILGGHFSVVQPYDNDSDKFLLEEFTAGGLPEAKSFRWTEPRLQGTARTALREGMLIVEDYDKEIGRPDRGFLVPEGITLAGAFRDVAPVKAFIGIRLEIDQEWLGVLFVNNPAPRTFSDEEKKLARFFATRAAKAIYNARAYEQAQVERNLADTLLEVAATLTGAQELQAVLDEILKKLQKVVPYDGALLMLPDNVQLAAKAVQGFEDRDEVLTFTLDLKEDLIYQAMSGFSPRPVIIDDVRLDKRFKSVPTVDWVRGWLGVPLVVKGNTIGQIGLYKREVGFYTPEHGQSATAFANQAALAINNAQLFESESGQRKFAEALRETVATINSTLDRDTVLKHILNSVYQVVSHDSVNLMLIDPLEPQIAYLYGRQDHYEPEVPPKDAGRRFEIDTITTLRYMRQSGKPIIIADTRVSGEWTQRIETHWIRSYVGAPIRIKGQVIGFLNLDNTIPNFYNDVHADRLLAFADQAGAAIENARLYDEARSYANRLGQALKIAEDLTTAITDPEQVLQTMIQRTANLLNVARGTFVRYEQSEGIIEAIFDEHPGLPGKGTRIPLSPLQDAVRTRHQIVVIENVAIDQRLTDDERIRYQALGVRSVMLVPLIARGKSIGHLGLSERRGLRRFSSEEQDLAQIVAGLAATAIDNSRIYGIAEEQLSDVIGVSQNLIREALRTERSLEDFFGYVIEQTLTLIKFDAGWLVRRESNFDRIIATDAGHTTDIRRFFAHDDSISGLSISDKKPIYISDLTNIPEDYRRVYKAPLESSGSVMKSELVVPLIVGERAIGAFNIEADQANAFQPRHIEMLQLLGSQAALAIELAASRETAAALSQFSIMVSKLAEVDKVAESVLTYALGLIGGRFGQVLLSEGRDGLRVHYTTNQPHTVNQPPSDKGMLVTVDDSVSGLAVQEQSPVIVPDVDRPQYFVADRTAEGLDNLVEKATDKPRYKRALEKDKTRVRAELALPIQTNGVLLGVLNVETPQDGFTPRQQQEVKDFLQENLGRFAAAFSSGTRGTLEELLKRTQALAGTNFVQILKYDLVSDTLTIEQTSGDEAVGTPVSVEGSITGRVVRTRGLVYVSDVETDPDYRRYLGEEMKSELVVPLMVVGDVIGVINVESATPAGFTLEQARRLEALAGPAALAINYARRIEAIRDDAIGLQARDIVHRLNNPIGAISFRLETAQSSKWYQDSVALVPELRKFVERTERDIRTTKDIIKEYRQQKGLEPTRMLLRPAIDEGLKQAAIPETIKYQLLMPDDAIQVFGNNRLPSVFWNLFDNARKAMSDAGVLTVTVDSSPDGEWVIVRVKDTGHGIPPALGASVFEPGVSTGANMHEPARGYGLPFVRDQVSSFGGMIEIESTEPGVGTCFRLVLRLAK